VLEYLFAAASVAVGWSAYLISFVTTTLHLPFPDALSAAPLAWTGHEFVASGKLFNLPAVLIVAAVTALLYVGVTQSSFVNGVIVAIKVTVICLFVGFGIRYVSPEHWQPFIPDNTGVFGQFGWSGVFRAATIVFFAYIGFDAVATAAGETKNPQRNMPIGLLGSLAVCTLIYIIVCVVLTGLMPYELLGTDKPVATALEPHPDLAWLKTAVEIGAIAGLSSVILVMALGMTRIAYTISRDGLLPHPRFRTPHVSTVIVGVIAGTLAGLIPLNVLGELVSMGTLLAFATVCIGVLVLRYTRPELARPFRVPLVWVICPLGAMQAFVVHWPLFVGWTLFGLCIYFGYGTRHSKLNAPSA